MRTFIAARRGQAKVPVEREPRMTHTYAGPVAGSAVTRSSFPNRADAIASISGDASTTVTSPAAVPVAASAGA